jgi:Ca2+-binding EF-hand superfamily protein
VKEQAKKEWKEAAKRFESNSDGKISFNEVLLAFAKEKGIYIDQISKKDKAELKQQFEALDFDNSSFITELDVQALYEKLAAE